MRTQYRRNGLCPLGQPPQALFPDQLFEDPVLLFARPPQPCSTRPVGRHALAFARSRNRGRIHETARPDAPQGLAAFSVERRRSGRLKLPRPGVPDSPTFLGEVNERLAPLDRSMSGSRQGSGRRESRRQGKGLICTCRQSTGSVPGTEGGGCRCDPRGGLSGDGPRRGPHGRATDSSDPADPPRPGPPVLPGCVPADRPAQRRSYGGGRGPVSLRHGAGAPTGLLVRRRMASGTRT
jgi:hypothetical protein